MGDRISIQFKCGSEVSPVLFSHWDGQSLMSAVDEYLDQLKEINKDGKSFSPLDRLEPGTVMVDFICQHIGKKEKGKRVDSNYYLAIDESGGDNSDNGHFVIDLEEKDPVKTSLLTRNR